MYLTYTKYKELGGNLSETSFNLLEYKSRKQIDRYTFGRLIDGIPEDIQDDIEKAMMVLIENNQGVDKTSNVTSESIDGYSISYGSGTEIEKVISNLITTLLDGLEKDGVPLLYTGGVNDNKHFYYPLS